MTAKVLLLIILSLTGWKNQRDIDKASKYADIIIKHSAAFNIDPLLIVAVIQKESGFREIIKGKADERGLMQIKPKSSASKGYDIYGKKALYDPDLNIYLGARHLARAKVECGTDVMGYYLSFYNGFRQKNGHCYKTSYSEKVMIEYRKLRRIRDGVNIAKY